MIGYGVVGSGYFGAELARIMNTKPGAVIRAVHDPENGAAVAAELGCDAEGSLKALVSRKDIQAVIVATPNYLHKEPVLAAAAHGLNVFCEKPIALSYGDCREMVRACQDNHVIFMAGHVMNFFRGVRRAKELIGQGAIGDILYCHGARNAWEGTGASETWKKTRSKSGGHLYHHIHELDCVQFLMGGCPDTVTMAGGNAAHRGDAYGDEDDMLFITMEYPGNRYALLEYGSAFRWQEHYLLVQGTKGAIKIDMCSCGMTLKAGDREEHFLVHRTKEEDEDRTRIYRETQADNGNQFGRPGRKPFLWLQGIMDEEMEFLNAVLHGAKVVAVYDPENAGSVAEELGCEVETDLDALYSREDVDAVIVASPNYLHKEPVIKAAEHGVHVFCEKPIALSFKDCVEMVEACVNHHVTFMAGHVMNFFHGVRTAKKMINDGVIGRVLYCHSARNGWEDIQPSVSWKKIRSKSGGHLYHHIHELDCIQFLMGGCPQSVTMAGGNVAHQGEKFGDEDDMLFITMEYPDNRYAILEYGSAFHWPEHYVLIQGTEGAIRLDMFNCGGTLKKGDKEEHFLIHKTREEDDDRTRIYHGTEMDGAIMYGKPGKKPPMWLHSIMYDEMQYFNGIMHGAQPDEEFKPLLTGEAARNAIATADACTRSRFEDRKVKLSEIMGTQGGNKDEA